jgi:NTP pyrophosphatase (non-canonical NTP hydrolase)
MNFEEYQIKSRRTAKYPMAGENFIYPTLGLCGEAGEVAEKIKKVIRDSGGKISTEKKADIERELGDVLWYLSQIATELGLSLEKVAKTNLDKLSSRLERGVLGGDGDNR